MANRPAGRQSTHRPVRQSLNVGGSPDAFSGRRWATPPTLKSKLRRAGSNQKPATSNQQPEPSTQQPATVNCKPETYRLSPITQREARDQSAVGSRHLTWNQVNVSGYRSIGVWERCRKVRNSNHRHTDTPIHFENSKKHEVGRPLSPDPSHLSPGGRSVGS